MADEQTAVAESSTAVIEAPATFEIPRSSTPEYTEWRTSGKLPEEKPEAVKTEADSSTADTGKDQTPEDAADSAATGKQEQKQGKRKPETEARFKQLNDENKRLKSELEEARRLKETKAESSPAKPEPPQTYAEWRKAFKPSQWIEGYSKENPEATYEDATAAMADHLGDVRDQFRAYEQKNSEQRKAIEQITAEARGRYGADFDTAKEAFTSATLGPKGEPLIPVHVLQMVSDSDVLADLVYTIGSSEEDLASFIQTAKTNPSKAARYIAKVESMIEAELAKGDKPRSENGQFSAAPAEPKPPAKRGPESAPAPPLEIGSRGTGPMDESERAFQAIERGDPRATRAFMDAENAKDLRRRRGV